MIKLNVVMINRGILYFEFGEDIIERLKNGKTVLAVRMRNVRTSIIW